MISKKVKAVGYGLSCALVGVAASIGYFSWQEWERIKSKTSDHTYCLIRGMTEGEQFAIRKLRRNIGDVVGRDCHTEDDRYYDPLLFEEGPPGKYSLPMKCGDDTIILHLVKSERRVYME